MPHRRAFLVPLALLCAVSLAQSPQQTPAQQAPSPTTVLRAGAQLVIVDVVVEDKDGHPVHGLKREDFTLVEGKAPQNVRNFETHTSDQPAPAGPPMPNLPPGTFTNYTAVPPNSTLNILLLDALNTPMKDQSYVRYQLQQYVKKAAPGTRIAIFGLSSRLFLLQGFTSEPTALKDAVEHKLIPRASNLLDDPVGGGAETMNLSDMAADMGNATAAANLQQFEAETQSFQTQLRTQYTLDAFNQLAHYLAAFPGRKNLIWFSGSFPLDIFPDADLADPFAVMASSEDEFRQTTNLLTRAQVAVYPVDARGLMTNPAFNASTSGSKYARNPSALSADTARFAASQAAEHTTMSEMADATGGHAFYNTNDLATAVAKSIEAGSNYYTLAYSPTNHDWNGSFRKIVVSLNGEAAARGLKLTYRRGYYADDPDKPIKGAEAATVAATTTTPAHTADAYARTAMNRGAPLPQDILFKVRALPATTTPEDTVAPGNQLNPVKPIKGPFRRFTIDYVALPSDFRLTPSADGNVTGAIAFTTFVYDPDGVLLNAAGATVKINLTPANYQAFRRQPVRFHLDVSAPVRGESYLRIGIHDIPANHFGAVEIPVSAIGRLAPPPPPPAAPASAPSTTPPAPKEK